MKGDSYSLRPLKSAKQRADPQAQTSHFAASNDSISTRVLSWSVKRQRQELQHRRLPIPDTTAKLLQRVIIAHQDDAENGWVWRPLSGSYYKIIPFDGKGVDPALLVGLHLEKLVKHIDGTVTFAFAGAGDLKAVVKPAASAKIYCNLLPFPRSEFVEGELKVIMEATVALQQCVRENVASTVRTIGFRFEGSEQMEFLRCWKDAGCNPASVYLSAY